MRRTHQPATDPNTNVVHEYEMQIEFEFESRKQHSVKSAYRIALGPSPVHQNTPKNYENFYLRDLNKVV